MTRPYPERNPFPYQGTSTVEAGPSEDDESEPMATSSTLLLDPIERMSDAVRIYLERCASPEPRQGMVVVLCGDHGTGKTHTLLYTIAQAESGRLGAKAAGQTPCQLYVKADGPDFLSLYRALMTAVTIERLRKVGFGLAGVMAGRQIGAEFDDRATKARIVELLRRDPDELSRVLRDYLVDEGAVRDRVAQEVGQVTGGSQDFQRALSFLLSDDPELRTSAYDWLRGEPSSKEVCRRLGVSGPIEHPQKARDGLRLLAALFRQAGQPLIVYIDQYEKLVLDPKKEPIATNIGLLHTLVEAMPRANAMLVVAGNEHAWNALTPDLKQRFAGGLIPFLILTPQQAMSVVHVYLDPRDDQVGGDEPDVSPFEKAAVLALLRFSAGNLRTFLQRAAASFDRVFAEKLPITEAVVEEVAKKGSRPPADRETVLDEIEQELKRRGLPFKRRYRAKSFEAPLAVLGDDGEPTLVVEVKEALFYPHEARRALESLDLVEKIRKYESRTQILLIAVGYVSPQVTEHLHGLVTDLLVHDETFPAKLKTLLDRLPLASVPASARPASPALVEGLRESVMSEVRTALEKMLVSREQESRLTDQHLGRVLGVGGGSHEDDRLREAKRAWAAERRRIEGEIGDKRDARRRKALEDLEYGRAKAMKVEQRARNMILGSYSLISVVGFVLWAFSGYAPWESPRYMRVLFIGLALLVGNAVMWLSVKLWVMSLFTPGELNEPVRSIEDLNHAVRAYAARSIGPRIHARNPQVRYASIGPAVKRKPPDVLVEWLTDETVPLVRAALARAMGLGEIEGYVNMLYKIRVVPEAAYLIEAIAQRRAGGPKILNDLSPRWRALYVLASPDHRGPRGELEALLDMEVPKSIVRAFEAGVDRKIASELAVIPKVRIEAAAKMLSPLDESGLGRFDELECLEKIDQYYLFFQYLLFLTEHDLLTGEPGEGEPSDARGLGQ